MSTVRVNGVVKKFYPQSSLFKKGKKAVIALNHVYLNVREGEVFCIIGPSGCGKTTLLRVIAGLIPPKDRHVGMVFQNLALYPHMNVRKNLTFSLRMRNLPPQVIREKLKLACRILGKEFELLLERKPGTLSEGQKRRVALGRCIVQDASLFLMDEPLANLDPKSSLRIRLEIAELLTNLKRTTLYVTHDQHEVPSVAKRVGIMREGRLEQVGSFEEVYNRPINRFVATFLGDPPMNLLQLILKENKSGLYLIDPPLRIDLPRKKFEILKEKGYLWKKLLLGIRPENIKLKDRGGRSSLMCYLRGRVLSTGMTLSRLLVYLVVGNQTLVAALDPFLRLGEGDLLPLCFSLDKAVIFDPLSGERIFP